MKKSALAITAIAAGGLSQPAFASAWCGGTVSASWVTVGGDFMIIGSWRQQATMMCNVKTEWKGVSSDVCATWMAKLDAAVSLGRSVTVHYLESVACEALPTYADSPAPYYVMLQ